MDVRQCGVCGVFSTQGVAEFFFLCSAEGRGGFDQVVVGGLIKLGAKCPRFIEDIRAERAVMCSGFDDVEGVRFSTFLPEASESSCEQQAEAPADADAGNEVASHTHAFDVRGVIPVGGVVEGDLHPLAECDGPMLGESTAYFF